MHRDVLLTCWPCVVALAVGCALLGVVVRISGARLRLARLRELPRCERGGVQSLAFVLTLPIFLMIVLFIVQVSQLMVAAVVVNYSAFAAARSASVWVPASFAEEPEVTPRTADCAEQFPEEPVSVSPPAANMVDADGPPVVDGDVSSVLIVPGSASPKLTRIRTAAILGLASIAPSRNVGGQGMSPEAQRAVQATGTIYGILDPDAQFNRRIGPRLVNKVAYADRNTAVFLEWRDAHGPAGRNSLSGPSYDPQNHPQWTANPNAVGWQDPLTVFVVHRFALLPGPGRFLADLLVRPIPVPQRVRSRLPGGWFTSPVGDGGSTGVLIPAAATVVNEGLKPILPYRQGRP